MVKGLSLHPRPTNSTPYSLVMTSKDDGTYCWMSLGAGGRTVPGLEPRSSTRQLSLCMKLVAPELASLRGKEEDIRRGSGTGGGARGKQAGGGGGLKERGLQGCQFVLQGTNKASSLNSFLPAQPCLAVLQTHSRHHIQEALPGFLIAIIGFPFFRTAHLCLHHIPLTHC